MKKLIFVLLCLLAVPFVSADDLKIKGYIKPDPIRGGNNYLIFNKDGKATGRISPDYIENRRYIIETVKDD
jgi:hypothetical protein